MLIIVLNTRMTPRDEIQMICLTLKSRKHHTQKFLKLSADKRSFHIFDEYQLRTFEVFSQILQRKSLI